MINSYKLNLTPNLLVELPLVITENLSYYSFNMLGMSRWNSEVARYLYEKNLYLLNGEKPDVIITVESKAIGLTEQLSKLYNIEKYIVVRKSQKSYMKNPLSYNGDTIISGKSTYWIDGDDLNYLKNKKIIICDDVISTGATINVILDIIKSANCKPLLMCCALTEGIIWQQINGINVVSCAHIPLPNKI